MNKLFTIIKVGYSAGIYGCSGEYFFAIIIKDGKIECIKFSGMYGADERIERELKDKGYIYQYIGSDFGKMTRNDYKRFIGEYEALELIKTNF
jgi:hypothetical protein